MLGHNGAGQVSTVAHHLLFASCHLQEIFLTYKSMFIYVSYDINRSRCARTGCYICISTPHGAPI